MGAPNSLLEQLQRDAAKKGAFQAKVAYAQYLIKHPKEDEMKQADQLLEEVLQAKEVPQRYQALAVFWKARYLQKNNEDSSKVIECYENFILLADDLKSREYQKAVYQLKNLNKGVNEVKYAFYNEKLNSLSRMSPKVSITSEKTPELIYKELRFKTKMNQLSLYEYRTQLMEVFNHPEASDTLIAKILYQQIKIDLQQANQTGGMHYLTGAIRDANLLTAMPEFKQMEKADRVRHLPVLIPEKLDAILDQVEVKVYARRSFSRFPIVDGLYQFLHSLSLIWNHNHLEQQAETLQIAAIKKLAQEVLASSSDESALFPEEQTQSHAIKDTYSQTACQIKETQVQQNKAYARVNNRVDDMQIFVKTPHGKTITINCNKFTTVENFKHLLFKREGVPPKDQRLIFGATQLWDDRTLKESGVERQSSIHMMLRLRGD